MIERIKRLFHREEDHSKPWHKCAIKTCSDQGFLRRWDSHTWVYLCDTHHKMYSESIFSTRYRFR